MFQLPYVNVKTWPWCKSPQHVSSGACHVEAYAADGLAVVVLSRKKSELEELFQPCIATVVVRRQVAITPIFQIFFFDQMWDAFSGSFESFWLNIMCLMNVWQLGCNFGMGFAPLVAPPHSDQGCALVPVIAPSRPWCRRSRC